MIARPRCLELVKLALMRWPWERCPGSSPACSASAAARITVADLLRVAPARRRAPGGTDAACISTPLAIIIPTSISSFRAHYRRGAVDMEIIKRWWLPIVLGVAAGGVTARFAPEAAVQDRVRDGGVVGGRACCWPATPGNSRSELPKAFDAPLRLLCPVCFRR